MIRTMIFSVILLFISHSSLAYETGCKYKPNQLNDFGTNITKIVNEQGRSLPDNVPVQADFEIESSRGKTKYYGTFEAFFRPTEDDFITFLPVPILGFDVSRDRVVIYICAHYTEKEEDSHVTIYFLRGYRIDPMSTGNFFGDTINGPSLKVKAVPATLLGISQVQRFFLKVFRYIPFVDLYFEGWSLIQSVIASAIGDITGYGVERIELTPKEVRVSSGVNLESPRQARFSKAFQIKRPDLGSGATVTPKRKSLKNPDQEQVLQDLNSANVEYVEVP